MNQLKTGAALNYVVILLNIAVGLLYTPYMLRMMGQSEYGLYSLVASVISYLTVLDLGLGNAVIRYTAKYRAEGKTKILLGRGYAAGGAVYKLGKGCDKRGPGDVPSLSSAGDIGNSGKISQLSVFNGVGLDYFRLSGISSGCDGALEKTRAVHSALSLPFAKSLNTSITFHTFESVFCPYRASQSASLGTVHRLWNIHTSSAVSCP